MSLILQEKELKKSLQIRTNYVQIIDKLHGYYWEIGIITS